MKYSTYEVQEYYFKRYLEVLEENRILRTYKWVFWGTWAGLMSHALYSYIYGGSVLCS